MTATTARPAGVGTGLPVLAEVFGAQRRALLLWGVAVGVLTVVYTSVYPAFAEQGGIESQLEALPPAVVEAIGYDIAGTAAGYVQSSVYGIIAMVLLAVHAIGRGSRLLAGQEEDGSLELELTSAVSRTRVYMERAAAVLIGSLVLSTVVAVVTMLMAMALDLDIPAGDVVAGGLSLFLFAAATGMITVAAGAATGRRVAALAAGAGITVIGYVAQAIAPSVERATWLGDLTPIGWHLGAQALVDGIDPARFGAMALVAVAALSVGLAVFVRRDLVNG